jgi:hypothetical protein
MKLKRTAALAVLSSLLISQMNGQALTWLNLETGPQWSLIKVDDPQGYFEQANVRSFMTGVTVGQEILPNFTLSTGLLYMPQMDGINMSDDRTHQSSWRSYRSFIIPVRAEYIIQPTESPLCFSPRIAYLYHMDAKPVERYAANSILSAPDGQALAYQVDQVQDQPASHMLELGMGLNFRFSNSWQTSLNISYMTALFDAPSMRYELTYTDPAGNSTETAYTSKGNAVYTTLALNMPLSNIWQNKDYRIRKRIENSIYKGKALEKRGQVYLGGELGLLWRSFSSNNPAVGPRPMEERGLFQYANMHTGIYAGYMLSNTLGIDVGAIYQRSSTSYALMYDHEVDFAIDESAPLYLEIPVRLRYFYDLYKGKIHVALYAGASLLSHFSSGVYNQGTADFTYNSPTSGAPVAGTTSYEASGGTSFAPVLRLGTGVEYKLPTKFPLITTLYLNYMQGYLDVGQIEVSTSIAENPALSTITYRGSGWSVDLGIKIPFRFGGNSQCGHLPQRAK